MEGWAQSLLKTADEHVPTVAIDLDGTLAEKMEPFDADKIGKPRAKVVKWAKKFKKLGARIIVFTVRGNKQQVLDWCEQYDVPVDYVNENPSQPEGSSGKVFADVYIDDKAINASGDWDDFGDDVIDILEAA